MESVKKWLNERNSKKNGVYVHYSPPKLVGAISAAQLRTWARGGEESKLERAVLAGHGRRLLAEAEASQLSPHLPTLIAKCDALHAAVERGSLLELQELLEADYNRRKYVMCCDEAGVGLLHKAVYYDFMDIAEYLVTNYPHIVHQKDSEGRTALHYAAVCRDAAGAAALLEGAGAARGARDAAGRTPAGYRGAARTLLALPTAPTTADMARDPAKNTPGLVIKRHNIRIWCHDCDMARLQRVVWEGHGARLLSEVSNQPIVKKFLEAVPYLMNTVRDIHQAVVQNDLESVMKNSSDPVPPQILSSRDSNNMTVMHKAAGLGHSSIFKYLVERYPQGINDVDNDGRTPLHYAAAMRDEQHTYNLLVDLGADESIVDNKNKTPAYYINRPQEIDKSLFKNIPDAPRTASSAYPSNWDWKLLDNDVIADLNKKSRRKNFKASTENLLSKNYSNTISESTDNRNDVMKASSTHEFIKDLPELDDGTKEDKVDTKEGSEEVEVQKESDDHEKDYTDEDHDKEEKHENEEKETAEENTNVDNNNKSIENQTGEKINDTAPSHDTDQNKHDKLDVNPQKVEEETENNPEVMDKIENTSEDSIEKESEESVKPSEDTEPNKKTVDTKDNNDKQNSDNAEGNVVLDTKNTENNTGSIEQYTNNTDHNTETTEQLTKNTDHGKENIIQITETNNIENTQHIADNINNVEEDKKISQNNESTESNAGENNNPRDETLKEESKADRPRTATMVPRSKQMLSENNNNQESEDSKPGNFNETNHTSSFEDKTIHNMKDNDVEIKVGNESLETQQSNEPQNDPNNIPKIESNIDEKPKTSEDNTHEINTLPVKRNGEHKNESTENLKNTRILGSAKSRPKTPAANVSNTISIEGNNNIEHNEDDDDVQVQGDNHSEYTDFNNKSTAEVRDMESAKRGHVINGRNTQESLIEGIISGEAEQDSQDASISQGQGSVHREVLVVDNEIDPEVTDLINNANMEMLATLVLNGEGARLIGRHSTNSELQAFLDNVPSYMQKINKVHLAAKEGNIRDLQSALDRRKFAIARDPISPNGATPLHVATVFGKTNIIKYLGGRFPETLSAVDFEGRTALHYGAVLPDNGHYYTLLQQLGANSKDLDDNGRSAEDYFNNPYLLPFEQLLSDFGLNEEAVKNMFSDKGTSIAGNDHMDIPIFKTEEGRYLAQCKMEKNIVNKMEKIKDGDVYTDTVFTALGDPLIKGLTEVANVKPKDPVAFLASFLQNFPDSEKPTADTEATNMVVTGEVAEVENEELPQESTLETAAMPLNGPRSGARTTTRSHRPIDVVTVDPQPVVSPDAPETAFSSANRDEHGQSMLHFAAARTHARNALFQLLQESEISLAYRDELYRTARDVSIQANVPENTSEIDKWVLHLAAKGNSEKVMGLLLEGYDHILDVVDEEGAAITEVVAQRGDTEMSKLLASIPTFEESRDNLHAAVRRGDLSAVKESVLSEGGRTLARSQNSFGRTALHVAVLAQHEDVVAYLAQTCPALLRVGDNLERTPLHYAMGVEKIESLSRILIRAGAKRVLKDLKGRQPSYYFMNKSDILRLKEEEEVY